MKKSSWFHKIVLLLNILFASLLLLGIMVGFIPSDRFPYVSPWGLAVPALVFINVLFVIYWGLQRKKNFLLSALLLIVGYFISGTFVKFSLSDETAEKDDLRVMSYNIRSFNSWGNIDDPNVYEKTFDFIAQQDPDIICFQEANYLKREEFKRYPYQHLKYINAHDRVLLGIFSKYPIVNEGTLDWPNSYNNGAFADIVYQGDTLRIYNLHMESLNVRPKADSLLGSPYENVYKRLTKAFRKQTSQARFYLNHRGKVPYKTIVCGDFNNNQFSNSYRLVKGDMVDTFEEKGAGFGGTYDFLGFPFRIDFILADPEFNVQTHTNYTVPYSDHFPVMASFRLHK